jgi:hypothetical protein
MHIPKTVIDLEALLYALEQQTEPLPEALQRCLKITGTFLQKDRLETARQFRQLIASYPPLENAYKKALVEGNTGDSAQERAKNLNIEFEELFIQVVIPTSDWVTTTQQLTRELASHPTESTPLRFWDQADRWIVITAGGAALGSAIVGVPGAIFGALLAAGYGGYITLARTRSIQNS